MSDVKKVAPQTSKEPEKVPSKFGDSIKVKNVSDKLLHLTSGRIKPGEEGTATLAEVICLSKFLKEV